MSVRNPPVNVTDWSTYYRSVSPTARLTRRFTTRTLINALASHRFLNAGSRILEFGGANSCFLDSIARRFRPSEYHVADTNQYGLDLLKTRKLEDCALVPHNRDVLVSSAPFPSQFDLVFSVGLVEHFDIADTAAAIRNHFRFARPGGLVLISFPCPTLLYRLTRGFLELAHLWRFPDERPLQPAEALHAIEDRGEIVFQKILWPIFLTQHMILARVPNPSPRC
jgi:SAM-dependent methyltransferase